MGMRVGSGDGLGKGSVGSDGVISPVRKRQCLRVNALESMPWSQCLGVNALDQVRFSWVGLSKVSNCFELLSVIYHLPITKSNGLSPDF
jgi:hypothetical protein